MMKDMPNNLHETTETSIDVAQQSVLDRNPVDEIVCDLNVLAEVKLPSTIHKSA